MCVADTFTRLKRPKIREFQFQVEEKKVPFCSATKIRASFVAILLLGNNMLVTNSLFL